MALYEHPDFEEHEHVSYCYDKATGLKAIIAVHNTQLGPSLGGCRMFEYASSGDALTDVLRLSRGMTYKAAMANLPNGGGKAVILGNPHKQKSKELMQAMGRFVNSFQGSYIIAEDSGISVQDVHYMASQTQYASGISARYKVQGNTPDGNPGPSTAYGVYCGIKSAVDYVYGEDLQGKRVAIQGIGNVGFHLAKYLHKAGATLYISDIFKDRLALAEKEFGATIVDNDTIHALDVDVFSPCALGGAINDKTSNEIRATIIAGAANNQLSDDTIDTVLLNKGITYVPDYVINAGGIIDIYHQSLSDSSDDLLKAQLQEIGSTIRSVLTQSKQTGIPTQQVANAIARSRFMQQ